MYGKGGVGAGSVGSISVLIVDDAVIWIALGLLVALVGGFCLAEARRRRRSRQSPVG